MRGGHGDRAQLVQRHDNGPELQMAAQYEHDLIALFDAEAAKQVRGAVAFRLKLPKGITNARARFIRPQHGKAFRFGLGNPVRHVVGEVEALRAGNAEFLVKIVIGGVFGGAVQVIVTNWFH